MPPRKRKSNGKHYNQDTATDNSDVIVPPKGGPRKKSRAQNAGTSEHHVPVTWEEFEPKFKAKYDRGMQEYLEDFQDDINSADNNLRQVFAKAKTALKSVGTKQAERITEVCQAAAAEEEKRVGGWENRLNHPLFRAGQEIFTNCHNIVDCHEQAVQKSPPSDASHPGDKWEADNSAVQEVISYGRLYGEKLVDCVITLDSDLEILKVNRDLLPETGNMAIDLYKKSSKAVGKETWGRTAEAQLNAVAAIVKTFAK